MYLACTFCVNMVTLKTVKIDLINQTVVYFNAILPFTNRFVVKVLILLI